ncbi:MAG: ABC-F family ATP-binding cassette domain-containing protein [Anaerolineae bacterium]|nr:ABC-F family ATP-binding cassette domain-containing protein [Anaerolineae bacterium]
MLHVNHVTKFYADQLILKDVSFIVNPGERIGLVGPNGCGKTTLLRIVMGQEHVSSGSVMWSPPDLRASYLAQSLDAPPGATLRDVLYPQARRLEALEADLAGLSVRLGESPDDPAVASVYAETLAEIERLGAGYQPGGDEAILAGLDLADLSLDDPVDFLSGGQKTRLGLARVLLASPQLLLLDEPTNHLDIGALEWLEDWLAGFPGAALIVSHDRTFLDRTVTQIVALDDATHTASVYPGNYTAYIAAVVRGREKQWAQWRDQVVEVERLKRDAQQTMARAVRKENATKNDQQRRYAKKVAKRAKAKEKRLERYLDDDERVEKPGLSWHMKLDFVDVPPGSQEALRLEELAVGYAADAPLLTDITLTLHAGERIALIGPNGSGKTTLLRTIIGALPPLAGCVYKGPGTRIGYLAQEQETLDPAADALATILALGVMSETDVRSFLHYFLFTGDEVFVPVSELSFGERSRLMLAVLVAQGCNLLILDEPINHLDVPSRERFEQAMAAFDGTVLAVVHDRYFVDRFATAIWVAEDGAVRRYLDRAEYRKVRADGYPGTA